LLLTGDRVLLLEVLKYLDATSPIHLHRFHRIVSFY
jgi:hypothetical protein